MSLSLNRSLLEWPVHSLCRRANWKMAAGFIRRGFLWAADGLATVPHLGTKARNQRMRKLRELCNLGYAAACPRLPEDRTSDAVRFSIARDHGARLSLWFVYESGHCPAGHGTLEYDLSSGQWISSHTDPRIQKMAECYLQSYLLRRIQPARAGLTSGTTPLIGTP